MADSGISITTDEDCLLLRPEARDQERSSISKSMLYLIYLHNTFHYLRISMWRLHVSLFVKQCIEWKNISRHFQQGNIV